MNNKINVKPEIDRLINILDYVKKGRLVVPEFQRDYIWDKKQRIDLFDSIKRGFPIGSLLFWNPESNDYEYNNKIGPYSLNTSPNKYSYIIDGYQRLTTLFCALINPEDQTVELINGSNMQDYIVYYDLENQEFSQPITKKVEPHYIPLFTLVDTFMFLSFSDKIKQFYDEETSTKYINRAKNLATILLDYSIAFVNINGGSIQDSVEIFSRINSKGSDMSPMWMLSALTYNDGFKFSEEIENLRTRLANYGFEELKTEIILQCIETATGKIYFDVKTESLAKRKDFKELCFSTFDNIMKTVKFLYEELYVLNYKLLPYHLQLIFISEFFKNNDSPTIEQMDQLKKWFWQTSYSNYFSIYSLSKQRKAFLKFQEFSKGKIDDPLFKANEESFIVSEFPKTIYYGSVRSKALALFMINNLIIKSAYNIENILGFDDFYSLESPKKDSEFMIPKLKGIDYLTSHSSASFKRNRDYSFILSESAINFDYSANFIPLGVLMGLNDLGKSRYYSLKAGEKEFVESLGHLEYDLSPFDFGKYTPF